MSSDSGSDQSNEMVRQAMLYAADLGNIITFLEQASASHSKNTLVERLYKAIKKFNLESTVKCFDGSKEEFAIGDHTPELDDKIVKARWETRVLSCQEKLFLSWENISVLIHNMPVANEERYGSVRDSLATLMNGADSRIEQIRTQDAWTAGINHMHKLLGEASNAVNHDIQGLRSQLENIMDNLSLDLKEALSIIDLSTEQEDSILEMLSEQISELKQSATNDLTPGEALEKLFFCVSELQKHQISDFEKTAQEELLKHDNEIELF